VRRAKAGRDPGSLRRLWLVLSALLLWGGGELAAQSSRVTDDQVKAVFLFTFAQFVDWPAETFPDEHTPFVIGILGDDPFGAYLDETTRGEKTGNRPLEVRRYRKPEEIKLCHVLFISRSEKNRLEQVITSLKDKSILTVADVDGFVQLGGMIRFVTEKNKIRLIINVDAAKAVNLTISSKLLRLAEIVPGGGR
jgi:hypothetical protein